MNKESHILNEVKPLIIKLRKGIDSNTNWQRFRGLIESNIEQMCAALDTRWLISICDTYVDYGDPVEKRNAMLVTQVANFEKLWATYLLMYDLKINPDKLNHLKKNKIIPLWDGMFSFNINHGDMAGNMFSRIEKLLADTPIIEKIFHTILARLKEHDTVLANLEKYHENLYKPCPRRSLIRGLIRRVRIFLKQYKL